MMTPTTAQLSVRNVRKSFTGKAGEVRVLDDLSFDINARDFVSIIGPSGCGKTTIFNIIAGLIEPDAGSMHYLGQEIDSLRADLAFYGRLLGGKREGLAVHALRVTQVPGSQAWNFIATLTQNFKRGDETSGHLSLAVEGVAGGKLETIEWKDLAQGGNVSGIAYAFKYFEQVRGTMMLPDGFTPNRVVVHAEGEGARAEQSFAWADAVKGQESENVP